MSIVSSIVMQHGGEDHVDELTVRLVLLSEYDRLIVTVFIYESFALYVIISWYVKTITRM